MESYERFYNASFIWNRKMMAFLGHDIYDKDFKPNIRMFIVYAISAIFVCFIIYTVCFYDNFVRFFNILYISLAVQVKSVLKYFQQKFYPLFRSTNFIHHFIYWQGGFKIYNSRYSLDFMRMITHIEQLFKLHIKTKSKTRQLLFQRFSFYSDLIVKCGCVMYLGSTSLCLPFVIYVYVFMNERVPLILIYVPGLDETTLSGYCILICIQFLAALMASTGLCCCDSFYALILSNTPIMSRLIEDEVNQLNKTLDETPNDVRTWKYQFQNIVIMHQELLM